jgi:uncharacterized BrkB/YihY/UPF0761 family membrane protein
MMNELAMSLVPIMLGVALIIGYIAHKNHWKIADYF